MAPKIMFAAVAVGMLVASIPLALAKDNKPQPPKTCPVGQQLVNGRCTKVKVLDFCPPEGCLVKPEGTDFNREGQKTR